MTIDEMISTFECIDDKTVLTMMELKKMLKCISEDDGDCTRAVTCFSFYAYDVI